MEYRDTSDFVNIGTAEAPVFVRRDCIVLLAFDGNQWRIVFSPESAISPQILSTEKAEHVLTYLGLAQSDSEGEDRSPMFV